MGKKLTFTGVKNARERSRRFLARRRKQNDRFYLKIARFLYRKKRLKSFSRLFYKITIRKRIRLTAGSLVGLMLLTVLAPVYLDYRSDQRYTLTTQATTLLGQPNENLTKKLSFDNKKQVYEFNKEAKKDPTKTGNPMAELQTKVGGEGEKDEQLYSVDVPKDLTKGITYYDNQAQLSFKMVPQFKTMPGEQRDGHLIYPLVGVDGQVSYTVTANGLKENVLLHSSPGDTFKTDYKLELPKSLEARLIPESGEVGVYSADPMLFGDITYGTSNDQEKVENARNNTPKTNLVFTIPAPYTTGLNGNDQSTIAPVKSAFSLKGDMLTVTTTGLAKADYPLAIDPTITVNSTSGFQQGNLDDNSISTATNRVSRDRLTGGSTGGWVTSANQFAKRQKHSSVIYNGYIYVIGGIDTNGLTNVSMAQLDAAGGVGAWSATASLPDSRHDHSSVVYNGYVFVLGGVSGATGASTNEVLSAKINPTSGVLEPWVKTTSLGGARSSLEATVYNGYVYVGGGTSLGVRNGTIEYAQVYANGRVGPWLSSAMPDARDTHSMNVYNGYMYVIGGFNGSAQSDVRVAAIQSDGSIGTWRTTTAMPATRVNHDTAVYRGYMYVFGGTSTATAFYAQIYANGDVGPWTALGNLPGPRNFGAAVIYNNYIYHTGGNDTANNIATVSSTVIGSAGFPGQTTKTGTPLPSVRKGHAAVAYNGFIYVTGGSLDTGGGGGTKLATAIYAQMNADGSLGSWTNGGTFANARTNHTSVAYNGFLYVIAGDTGSISNDIQYAPLAATGGVGTWASAGTISGARREHTSTVYNGNLYVAGGWNTTSMSEVGHVPINPNGTITVANWVNDTALIRGVNEAGITTYNGVMYVVGGYAATLGVNASTAQYARIDDATGNITSWTDSAANAGVYQRTGLTATAYKGFLYIIGGNLDATYYGDIQFAAINGGAGSPGSFNTLTYTAFNNRSQNAVVVDGDNLYSIAGVRAGGVHTSTIDYLTLENGGSGATSTPNTTLPSLPSNRLYHESLASNGYLYVIGGDDGGNYLNTVQMAPILDTGALGSWTNANSTATLFAPRLNFSAAVYNGYMYVMGGFDGTYRNDVMYAPINSTNGTLGAWVSANSSTAFPARNSTDSFAKNGYLYVVGGYDGSAARAETYYAQINPSTGMLGAWTTTSNLTVPRYAFTAINFGNYVYAMSGVNNAADYEGTIESALINVDGTLGAWSKNTAPPRPRFNYSAFAVNGMMYLVGGFIPQGVVTPSVEYASIDVSGRLNGWSQTTSLATPRYRHASAFYNGTLYTTGGLTTGNAITRNVEASSVKSMPRKALYSKVIDLGLLSNISSVAYTGITPVDSPNLIKYRTADADNNIFGPLQTSVSSCSELAATRYLRVEVMMDDTQTAGYRDAQTGPTSGRIESITVVSSPFVQAKNRLRHGAQFQGEKLQAFDARAPETCTQS